MTTQQLSPAYRDAVTEVISAEGAFWEASISEAIRLIPDGVSALIFRINDTPRLTFDAYLDQDGTEHEADEIDGDGDGDGDDLSLFDALDEIAMQLNVHEHDDAATWLLTYSGERFVIEREWGTTR